MYREFYSCQTIYQKVKENPKTLVFLLGLFLVSFGVSIYLIILFASSIEEGDLLNAYVIVLSFVIAFFLTITGIVIRTTMKQFCCIERKKVEGVLCMVKKKK
jgi:hypothetical protein